jgi:hypothetical protein
MRRAWRTIERPWATMMVLFPAPVGPTKATISPGFTAQLRSRRTQGRSVRPAVAQPDALELDLSADLGERRRAGPVPHLGLRVEE